MVDFFSSLLGGLFGQKQAPPAPPVPPAPPRQVETGWVEAITGAASQIAEPLPAPQQTKIGIDVGGWFLGLLTPSSPLPTPPKPPTPEEVVEGLPTVPSPAELTPQPGPPTPPPLPGERPTTLPWTPGGTGLPGGGDLPSWAGLPDEWAGRTSTPVATPFPTTSPSPTEAPRGATPIAAGVSGGKYGRYLKPGRYILSADTWGLTRKETFGSSASFMQEVGGDFYDVVGYTSLKLVVHQDGSYNLWSRSGATKIAQIRSSGGPESIKYVDPLEEAGYEVRVPTVATPTPQAPPGFPSPTPPSPSSVVDQLREQMPTADPATQLRELERLAERGAIDPRDLAEARQAIESGLISQVENVTVTDGREVIKSVREVIQIPLPGEVGGGGTNLTEGVPPPPTPGEVVSGVQDLKDALKPKIGSGW